MGEYEQTKVSLKRTHVPSHPRLLGAGFASVCAVCLMIPW